MVAYDYDDLSIYANFGHDSLSTTHTSIFSGYDYIYAAGVLFSNKDYNRSNNFMINSVTYDYQGNHVHNFGNYEAFIPYHKTICTECEHIHYSYHIIESSNNRYENCIDCGCRVDKESNVNYIIAIN